MKVVASFCLIFILGIGSAPVFGQKNEGAVFSNPASITINTASGVTTPSKAALYPSPIDVTGMTGSVTRVAVTLDGVNHTWLSHLDFLLVSPTGAKYIFFSDGNAGFPAYDATDNVFTFADDAPTSFPNGSAAPSGNYKPTSGDVGADTFPAPAPSAPYNQPNSATFASTFNGSNPNGTWSLYAVDDALNESGSVNSGWSLTVTTDGAPQTFSNQSFIALKDVTETASPYSSNISVSGLSGVISDINVTFTGVSHTRPADIDILLVSPNGRGAVIMSDISGSAASNVNLTFDDSAAAPIGNVVTGTYQTRNLSDEVVDVFQSPAPLRPIFNSGPLSNFNGFSPNGDWKLFVMDDSSGESGSIAGGWSIEIATVPAPPPASSSCAVPTFAQSSFPVGINPTNVAISDFNNDGKMDLAVTNQVSNNVSIMLGNGDGSFGAQSLITAASGPYAIVAGKFNTDNNWDLAVVNSSSNNVSILLGNGNGTFAAPVNFFVGANPISIAAGDLNNDGKTDLAVANFGGFFAGTVSVLLGTGSGGFTNGTSIRTRSQPSSVAIGRLNSDANDDLAVASFGSNSFSIFLGTGTGLMQLLQTVTTQSPAWIELANLSGDSSTDYAIANYDSDQIMRCEGSAGGFVVGCFSQSAGLNPISIAAADFVSSGTNSLATAVSGSNSLSVAGTSFGVGDLPNAVRSADLNSDGKPDLVSVNSGSNDVSVLVNSCRGARGNVFDFNGDRLTDYALFRPSNGAYYIQSVNPNGSTRTFGRASDKIAPADYSGDRRTDFAFFRPSSGTWFVIDSAAGGPVYFTQFGIAEDIPAPGDFDGDGRADIAVFRPSTGTWYVRRSGDNSVHVNQFGMNGDQPVASDFDGDGKADFGIYRPSTGVWYIGRSSDNGVTITQFGIVGDRAVAADYDGDGKSDLAVFRPSTSAWYVLKSSDGGFYAVTFGLASDIPLVGEYDGDGKFDYSVYRPSTGVWYVQRSSDANVTAFQFGLNGDVPIPGAFVR